TRPEQSKVIKKGLHLYRPFSFSILLIASSVWHFHYGTHAESAGRRGRSDSSLNAAVPDESPDGFYHRSDHPPHQCHSHDLVKIAESRDVLNAKYPRHRLAKMC